jgi:hypothetical protein
VNIASTRGIRLVVMAAFAVTWLAACVHTLGHEDEHDGCGDGLEFSCAGCGSHDHHHHSRHHDESLCTVCAAGGLVLAHLEQESPEVPGRPAERATDPAERSSSRTSVSTTLARGPPRA